MIQEVINTARTQLIQDIEDAYAEQMKQTQSYIDRFQDELYESFNKVRAESLRKIDNAFGIHTVDKEELL